MVDERLRQGYNKIRSEFSMIIYYAAIISFIVKTTIWGMAIKDTFFEFAVILFFPIYLFIRTRQLGLEIPFSKKRNTKSRIIINMVVCAEVGAVVFFMNKGSIDIKEVAVFLVAYVAAFRTIRIGLIKIEKKRAEKMEKEFDDD